MRHNEDLFQAMMSLLARFLWLSIIAGCTATLGLQITPLESSPSLKETESLERAFQISPIVAYRNPPPPEASVSPELGATSVYARVGSANARLAPMDIEIELRGSALKNQARVQKKVMAIHQAIYGWDPDQWSHILDARTECEEVIRTKSNFFWESLAQHVAERVFTEHLTPLVYLYGPSCVNSAGELKCAPDGLSGVDEVRVKTTIDGRRDPLNPQTRSIVYVAHRGRLQHPDVYLELNVPTGMRVAGPEREYLDLRPLIAGSRETIHSMRILVHLPANARTRTQNEDYADYNLLFVPLRHLVFQGAVDNPKRPETSLNYETMGALRRRFETVVQGLRSVTGATQLVDVLRPYLTSEYYYMFDEGQGVSSYRDYILGPNGIAGSITPDVGAVQLIIE